MKNLYTLRTLKDMTQVSNHSIIYNDITSIMLCNNLTHESIWLPN